jgi:predicted acylesterase/phospholipase RssA
VTAAEHTPSGAPPAGYTGPRRSLILAGGGMRVAYQAGVIRALLEAGLVFAHADGTSGGTINLAMLLSGLTPPEMCDRWRGLNVKDFASFMPLTEYLKGPHLMALGDADGIVKHVFPGLGIDVDRIRAARGVDGTFNVCNYTDKTNQVIDHTDVDLDLLVAGISLPIFMPPVLRGDQLFVDSVWIRDANVVEAVKRGAEELWLVWLIGNEPEYHPGPFRQYVHMIELSANGGLFEDFDRIQELNRRIDAGDSPYGQTRPIKLHVIKPRFPLPLDPDFYAGRIDADALISMGYRDARRYLDTMSREGLPFSKEVTKMERASRGVMFRETMLGPFALGVSDPHEGAKKGEAEGSTLVFHANIDIEDVELFMADPEHAATLTGDVSFTPFGERIPSVSGVFNLFSPGGEKRLKLMVYEQGFEREGQSYYVAGHKEVRDDPGFDLWEDTTTLYTTLHKGATKEDPVVGAGILRLDMKEFTKILSTMHVTNAGSMADRTATLAKFGKWFMGELWDTYHGG